MLSRLLMAALAVMLLGSIEVSAQGKQDTKNRKVLILNDSSRTISLVYAEPTGKNNSMVGGSDWIPNDTLAPGQFVTVNFDDKRGTCILDLQGYGDSNTWTERRFNVCGLDWWRLVD